MPLIRWLGSLSFTVVICVLLIILLIVSTMMEAKLGTDAVQKMFYQTRWFDLLLSLFWINIFCSTALRFPFQRGHIGFIITHIGILALLMGALMSRIGSIEGRMLLFEGETSRSISTGGYHLSVKGPAGAKQTFVLSKNDQRIPADLKDVQLRIGTIIEHAAEEEAVADGGTDHPLNHAVRVNLESAAMGMRQNFRLIEHSPVNPDADAMIMGPAHFLLKPGTPPAAKVERPTLTIKEDQGREALTLAVDEPQTMPMFIGDTGLRIENLLYYPQAAVAGRELVNGPEGTPENPAVAFDIVDANGIRQHVIKFALFPDFESMHPKDGAVSFPVSAVFQSPARRASEGGMSALTFYYWPDGRWTYEATVKSGGTQSGDLKTGVKIPLDWADMTFDVSEILDHAAVTTNLVESKDSKTGPFAAELIVTDKGRDYSQWLTESQNVRFTVDGGDYRFAILPNTADVPFALTLNDFQKIDYPGTMAAASYESGVTLEDVDEDTTIKQVIRMNEPLDYKGYRIFQSSYIEDNGRGEASIFTVAKNPGIPLIYLGSCIIFIGAAYQFYGPKNGVKNKKDNDDDKMV